jgi:hypothetical protein
MAGSVNIAARRPQSANITVTASRRVNIRKARRWRSGLTKNTGGGSYAPAAASPNGLAKSASIRVVKLFLVIAQASCNHSCRFGAIVNIHDLDLLSLFTSEAACNSGSSASTDRSIPAARRGSRDFSITQVCLKYGDDLVVSLDCPSIIRNPPIGARAGKSCHA